MNKKVCKVACIAVSIMSTLITGVGCQSKLNILAEDEYDTCRVNLDNGSQFIYNNQSYTILNEEVEESLLGERVGAIKSTAILDNSYKVLMNGTLKDVIIKLKDYEAAGETYLVSYKSIYKVRGSEAEDYLIIQVNGALHKAVQSEKMAENDEVIKYVNEANDLGTSNTGFSINSKDCTQVINGNNIYQITDIKVENSELGEYLGVLGQSITFDAETKQKLSQEELQKIEWTPDKASSQKRCLWNYGKIYSINNEEVGSMIAIQINNKYVRGEAVS